MIKLINIFILFFCTLTFNACKQKDSSSDDSESTQTRTPVTVISVSLDSLQQYIELNATTSYLQKSFVKSNITGYVKRVSIKIGDYVNTGQSLFVLQTKESEAIGNSVNKLNPDFKFSGVNTINANSGGFISELDHQPGDYVQDGEQLAVVSDSKSFVFVVNVPYEDQSYVSVGKNVDIFLPDNERLSGTVSSAMPMMDSVSQTQSFAIKVNASHKIPQGLVAKVRIVKVLKPNAITLPKNSVLSDETQSEFWVMKLINDTTAVKVTVKKGIEENDKIEITAPLFSANDKILLTGNYGLPDTALVIVQK